MGGTPQCQRVDVVGIANPGIKAGDFVDAVDVWSWVTPNTQVCFDAAGGGFKFIDTTAMPRTVSDLPAYRLNGRVCAMIGGPGILVLLPGSASSMAAMPGPARSLSGCMVRTTADLNFRAGPGGAIIGAVLNDWTLTALARTAGWFKVDRFGAAGWISADYVEPIGDCG